MPCETRGMATKSTTSLETPLREQLDRLAAFDPSTGPVISLYLDMRADQNGQRGHAGVFLRNSVDEQTRSLKGEARTRFHAAAQRIEHYLAEDVPKSVNGLAVFASTTSDFFEAIPLDVPI